MIKSIHLFLLCLAIFAGSCSKNEFEMDFQLSEEVKSTFRVLFYASDSRGGRLIETAAILSNGKAHVVCPARNPSLVYLYTSSASKFPLIIYARRGNDIKIYGSSPNPNTWTVSGNDINEELSRWRNDNDSLLSSSSAEDHNQAVENFVKKNPSSPVSAILLLTSFSRADNDSLFRSLWRSLRGEAADPEWVRLAGRADVLSTAVRLPARLKNVVMRSLANGTDTLHADSVKGSLFFFWHNSLNDRRQRFDSIRALAKHFPDSVSRIIADVNLDADSLSWKSSLRSDSLKKVNRLWAPAGLADRRLMKFDVPRSPYYIVFAPDGKQIYRGDNATEAFDAFRSLMKKPD